MSEPYPTRFSNVLRSLNEPSQDANNASRGRPRDDAAQRNGSMTLRIYGTKGTERQTVRNRKTAQKQQRASESLGSDCNRGKRPFMLFFDREMASGKGGVIK